MYFIETRQLGLEPESARKDKQTFLSLSRHIKKQLGKRNKKFLFARILKPNKPAKGRLFLSKKSTDDCYLIAVKNKNSSFIPEQRKKRLNNFLEICIHLKYLIRRNNKRFSVQENNLWSNFFHQL